ncbi:DUF7321 family protein [Halococcus sediminicola]|uniref:DUF7321 family protein n=1 Tax=Halococcus sediminicola TaxID=1264579 RepID=UPI000679A791|nr:hypothetical protein [Halococcus sediminicola]
MFGLADATVATVVALLVTASFPLFLYGAWIMIDTEDVTWGVLVYHLKFIFTGLALTTIPLLFWMVPRLFGQLGGASALHAFLGLQAYALLAFAFTGIIRIFRAKRRHNLYHDYDEDVLLDEIGSERMDHWRSRLRIGVFGYVIFWLLAYLVGIARYVGQYLG